MYFVYFLNYLELKLDMSDFDSSRIRESFVTTDIIPGGNKTIEMNKTI